MVGGASPWSRIFGPTELSAFTKSPECTNTAKYVTAQSAANGPAMFRREGASIYFDAGLMSANFCNIKTTAANFSGLTNQTIAVLVYVHKLNVSTAIILRIGSDASNYVTYRWGADENLLQEGWNVLLCHTGEPIGVNTAGQRHYQGAIDTGWTAAAGAYNFGTTANYVAFEINGATGAFNTQIWVEGIYKGGRDKPRITIGFDISSSGLNQAKASMDKYGFVGYAAVPTANANPAAPAYLWDTDTVARLQNCYKSGWDIIQHSVSHNSMGNYVDDSMILNEFDSCRQQISAIGCSRARDLFATPNGSASNRVVSLAAASGIKFIRNVNKGKMLNSVGLVGIENPLNIGCFDISNTTDTSAFQNFISLLVQYGVSGHIYTHSIVQGASDSVNTNVTLFEQMLAYLKNLSDTGVIEVVTPSKWLALSAPPGKSLLSLPGRLSVTPRASPYNHINTGYEQMMIFVSGGTVSAIDYSRDGSTFDATGQIAGVFTINPGDRIRITYSVVPTVIQMRSAK